MNTEIKNENELGYKISIEELKLRLEEVYGEVAVTKATFRSIFSAASLVVSLIGAVQLFSSAIVPEYQLPYWILLGASLILYVILVGGCIWMLSPIKLTGTTPAELDYLKERFIAKDKRSEVYQQQIVNYVQAIEMSEKEIRKRYRWEKPLLFILPIIVILLLVIGLLPRVPVS